MFLKPSEIKQTLPAEPSEKKTKMEKSVRYVILHKAKRAGSPEYSKVER